MKNKKNIMKPILAANREARLAQGIDLRSKVVKNKKKKNDRKSWKKNLDLS